MRNDTADPRTSSQRRAQLRERAYRDGYTGKPRADTDAEYLTSYRRGTEARRAEQAWAQGKS